MSSPSFEQQFALMSELAADSHHFWMGRHLTIPSAVSPELVIEVFGREYEPGEHPSAPFQKEDRTYQHRLTNDPDHASTLTTSEMVATRRFNSSIDGMEQPKLRKVTTAWVAGTFALAATVPSHLARTLAYASNAADEGLSKHGGAQLTNALHDIVIRSLDFLPDREGWGLLGEVFTSPPSVEFKRRQVSAALGKLLIDNPVGSFSTKEVAAMDKQQLVRGILAFDKLGLVTADFWENFGVIAGGAIKVPQLLPMLYEKLRTAREAGVGNSLPSRLLVQAYITAVLRHTIDDSGRHGHVAAQLLSRSQFGRPEENVDVWRFVEESNAIIRGFNMAAPNTDEPLTLLSGNNLADSSEAFLRMMAATRLVSQSIAARVAQVVQDARHAEIISLLSGNGSAIRSVPPGEIRLQLPDATDSQIANVQRLMADGMSLARALQAAHKQQ